VTFLGAGIYEEFLFRLCLLPIAYAAFRALMIPHRWSVGGTILVTSLVFSLAHYLGPAEDGYSLSLLADAVARVQSTRSLWFSFVFRTLAGMFFSALFFLRGFGITVGAHAAYDVIVGVVLISEL
jgi:membrane protease YdiL (CAAX protease family)